MKVNHERDFLLDYSIIDGNRTCGYGQRVNLVFYVEQKMKQDTINLEAISALNKIVNAYIKEFFPKPPSRKKEGEETEDYIINKTRRSRDIEYLMKCSEVDEPNREEINHSIFLTIEAMKKFEYEANGEITERKEYRRKVEQIKSILHIGLSHPDSAIKRLKELS